MDVGASSLLGMSSSRKVLLLTVGYGEGHNTAARSMAQAAEACGWEALVVDPCKESSPAIFAVTREFYRFCVRSAPWIWAITYAQTETADWSTKAHAPILKKVTRYIKRLVDEYRPNFILCTYPLYAYMLDALREEDGIKVPYGVVVTDALEISRPWMLSKADVVYVPDEYSLSLVKERYALDDSVVCTRGFPVGAVFRNRSSLSTPPTSNDLRITYGAYAPIRRVRADIRALLQAFPGVQITVIAGARKKALERLACSRVKVIAKTDNMVGLFENSHIYIGKAGAATVFEAYSLGLPVIINYALPGQEQGNLALLLLDGAGRSVDTTADLVATVRVLLHDNAALWQKMRADMIAVARRDGAANIFADVLRRFSL